MTTPLVIWLLAVIPTGTAAGLISFFSIPVGNTSLHITTVVFAAWLAFVMSSALVAHELPALGMAERIVIILLLWITVATCAGLLRGLGATNVLRDLRGFLFYAAIIPAAIEIQTAECAKRIVWHFVAACVAYATLMIVLSVAPSEIPIVRETLTYWYGDRRLHFHNTFFLPSAAIMAATHAFFARGNPRLLSAAAIVPLLVALWLSQTRSALLVTFVGVGFVAVVGIIERGRRARLSEIGVAFTGISGFAAIVAAAIAMREVLSGRVAELVQSPLQVATFVERFSTFATAVDIWSQHKVAGWGLGKLVEIPWATIGYKPWLTSIGQSGSLPGVDNSFLTAGFKTGLIGVVLIVLVWTVFAAIAFRAWISTRTALADNLVALGIAASVPCYIVIGLTQNVLVAYSNIAVWMVFLRIVVVIHRSTVIERDLVTSEHT